MDRLSEARLDLIHPRLAEVIRRQLAILQAEWFLSRGENLEIRICQGVRSWPEQASLYAKGRTMPGEPCRHAGAPRPVGTCPVHRLGLIVTRCRPGYSWHQFGLAVDEVPDDPTLAGFQCDWNLAHPAWQRMKAVGESLGLVHGSEFRTFPDWPHFQLTGRFGVNPDDEVRQLFRDGGMQAVWEEARIE